MKTATKPTEEKVQLIPLEKLHISEHNTRQPKPTEASIKDLAKSLKVEQTSPIVVRPHPKKKGHYEIATGARRRVAAGVAELKMLKAIVRQYDDDAFEEVILTDNIQREDPEPYAEAILLKRMIDRGTKTPKEIAAALGRTETWAVRRFRLATLDPALLKAWGPKGRLEHFSADMMDALAALPDEAQKTVAADIKENWKWERIGSRAALEEYLTQLTGSLKDAKWLHDPRTFIKGCGPGCASDSSKKAELFDFSKKESCGRCLNPSCFRKRHQKFLDLEFDRLCAGEKLRVVVKDSVTLKGTDYKQDYNLSWELKGKSSPGAEKVITFSKGKLAFAWLPKKQTAKNSGSAAKTASPEERQQAKIDTLQGKRWLLVRDKLFAAIQSAKLTDLKAPLDSLIAIFGLPYKEEGASWKVPDAGLWSYIFPGDGKFPTMKENSYMGYSPDPEEDADDEEGMENETFDANPGRYNSRASFEHAEPDTDRETALWPAVRHVLLGLIPTPQRIADVPKWEPHYRHLAKLIGFPVEIHKRKADLEILPPKSWGKVDPHTLEPVAVEPPAPKQALDDMELEDLNNALHQAVIDRKKTAFNKVRAELKRRYSESGMDTSSLHTYEDALKERKDRENLDNIQAVGLLDPKIGLSELIGRIKAASKPPPAPPSKPPSKMPPANAKPSSKRISPRPAFPNLTPRHRGATFSPAMPGDAGVVITGRSGQPLRLIFIYGKTYPSLRNRIRFHLELLADRATKIRGLLSIRNNR